MSTMVSEWTFVGRTGTGNETTLARHAVLNSAYAGYTHVMDKRRLLLI